MAEFSYKLHSNGTETLLAISDSSLIGKTIEEKDIEISIDACFYEDKKCDNKKALDLVKNSMIVNAIGRNIVDLLLKEGFISKDQILIVSGVPHAQIITLL